MLKLRFTDQVPDHAVNVGYTEGKDLTVEGCVSLLDMAHRRPENLSSFVGGEADIDVGSGYVDTKKVLLSPRSVRSQNVKRPVPLFYKHRIGGGTYHVAIQNPTSTLYLAKIAILKSVRLLGRDDSKISDVDWDIEVVGQDPATHGYVVDLYLSYRQARHETYKIQYQAVKIVGALPYPNHVEVVNATPVLNDGVDYTLSSGSNGYAITGLSSPSYSDGIGIFKLSAGTGAFSVYSGTTIRLTDTDGTYWNFTFTGKSIQQVVNEINEHSAASVAFRAVALDDNPICALQNTGSTIAQHEGVALKQLSHVRVRYDDEVQVRSLEPYPDSDSLPWYPRVSYGEFSQVATYLTNPAQFVFRPLGDDVKMPHGRSAGYYERIDERPIILGPKMLRLRRPNVDTASIKLYRGEQELTGLLQDCDQLNSILFLSQEVGDSASITVSYRYSEDSFIYTGVDLNPLIGHSPDLYGRYVGVYMVPAEILRSAGNVSFTRTIYHTIADDIPSIIANVNNVKFTTGEDAEAILLGIYRVGQPAVIDEVKITDTRSRGGGIRESVDPLGVVRAEEARMFMDISMWDGEPFPPAAVIVNYPSEMIGTGIPSLHRDPASDPSGFFCPSGLLSPAAVQYKMDRYKAAGVIAIPNPEDSLNG